jgi:DNA-binding transcriptional LysR family regulator
VRLPWRYLRFVASSIQLRHLRYFLAVMEEQHFGRAAERLYMAQPPLSQAIAKLEEELGVDLLLRTSRGVVPTEAGEVFAERARTILAELDAAVEEVHRVAGSTNPLRIGFVPYRTVAELDRFLAALRERHPGVTTRISHMHSYEQLARLRARELDIGILVVPGDEPGLEIEPLLNGQPVVAFVPADSPLAHRERLTPADLRDHDLVLFPRDLAPALHDWLTATFKAGGYSFRGVQPSGGAEVQDMVAAVAQGLGVSLGSLSMVEAGGVGTLVAARPIDPPMQLPETVVAWRADQPRTLQRVTRTLREIVRAARED